MKPLASFPGSLRPDSCPAPSGIVDTTWESMECKHIFSEFVQIQVHFGKFPPKYCCFGPNSCKKPQYMLPKNIPMNSHKI